MTTKAPDKEALEALRHRIRHSAAHIMADAIQSLFPEAKLTLGPPTDTGFYYDLDLPRALTPEDLKKIEGEMAEIIAMGFPFVQEELARDVAKRVFGANPYKAEIIDSIPLGEKITIYKHGGFTDLCEGPHVDNTLQVAAVKLLNVAGAYWRGDEKRPMLQRVYGTAFESQDALDQFLAQQEEAAKRDHRRLGRELDLFMFDPVAPASPFFFPKGAIVYNQLVAYIRDLYAEHGYEEVITPQIFSTDLWKRSGHYENYLDSMFMFENDEREFGVKPMNCPAHAVMYGSRTHSYRELPIRYADFGRLHRYERSGVTHGLTRVRTFSQDDSHIFCRIDQVETEITQFLKQFFDTYRVFGFNEVRIRLSLRPDKRVGTDDMWYKAEAALEAALKTHSLEYTLAPGEGTFYGPKLDFLVSDAIGREWQMGTLQLDFNLPERFELDYINEAGEKTRPVVIHRAWLGSIERFMGILVEHTAGAFPVWLAPVQAVLIPIADRHNDYANGVAAKLKAAGLRVEVDARGERMNLKVREAQLKKVPYMLVVGDREVADNAAAVRLRTGENPGALPIDQVLAEITDLVKRRA